METGCEMCVYVNNNTGIKIETAYYTWALKTQNCLKEEQMTQANSFLRLCSIMFSWLRESKFYLAINVRLRVLFDGCD